MHYTTSLCFLCCDLILMWHGKFTSQWKTINCYLIQKASNNKKLYFSFNYNSKCVHKKEIHSAMCVVFHFISLFDLLLCRHFKSSVHSTNINALKKYCERTIVSPVNQIFQPRAANWTINIITTVSDWMKAQVTTLCSSRENWNKI